MKTGNGKIANLPAEIRDELNRRLDDGDPGNELVEWLNSKREVIETMKARFDGSPISEQNLSEWRKRGHQQWLADRMIIEELGGLSEHSDAIGKTGIGGEKLLLILTAAYAVLIQNWEITPKDELTNKMAVFRNLTNGVLAVRRGELQAIRIEIARERLELIQEKRRHVAASSSSRLTASVSSRPRSVAPKAASRSGTSAAALTPSASLSHNPMERFHSGNASDYFDSLGLSPWTLASLPGSRLFTLPHDTLGGTLKKPLCTMIQPEKLAA